MFKLFRLPALAAIVASSAISGSALSLVQSQPAPAAAPVLAPAVRPALPTWRRAAAEELLAYVEAVGAEGLSPATYDPEGLRAAISAGDEAALATAAGETFLKLTSDLSGGSVRGADRIDWHMTHSGINGNEQQRLLAGVAAGGGVADALNALLPRHPQYHGLKRALSITPASDRATRDLIRTNMERWRWMPRGLGSRHVIVNVPAFTAAIVENGRVIARHRTVVGAVRTPTPQLNATIQAVTFNPWWHVPQSIIAEMGGRFRGYEVTRNGNSIAVRQPPGPANSLGRVKIEMPNEHAIYLHDTPAQSLFSRPVRAFSHGCVRTQNIRDFAAILLGPTGQWDRSDIDRAIDTGRTTPAQLAQPIPVYVAYFTAAATEEGQVVPYRDIYGRDGRVREALNRARTS